MSGKRVIFDTALQLVDSRWKVRNHHRPRVLMYTDSRGLNLSAGANPRFKHHLGSHVDKLQRDFHLDHIVCPARHTTLIDFLTYIDLIDVRKYDAILLHCGVVDFSPRPMSSIDSIRNSKQGLERFDRLFSENSDFFAAASGSFYRGERTTSLYPLTYLDRITDELRQIPNLGWISSNSFVPGWNGNWMPRPSDIDAVVASYDDRMLRALPHSVNLRAWNFEDVQRFTTDNIHFTKPGFVDVAERARQLVGAITGEAPGSGGRRIPAND